jgi:hypothetical protein
MDHPKTGYVWISDPHCSSKKQFAMNIKLVGCSNGQFRTQIMSGFQMAVSAILFLTIKNLDLISENST